MEHKDRVQSVSQLHCELRACHYGGASAAVLLVDEVYSSVNPERAGLAYISLARIVDCSKLLSYNLGGGD